MHCRTSEWLRPIVVHTFAFTPLSRRNGRGSMDSGRYAIFCPRNIFARSPRKIDCEIPPGDTRPGGRRTIFAARRKDALETNNFRNEADGNNP